MFDHSQARQSVHNLPSAMQNQQVVDDKLSKELALGRIKGPFTEPVSPSGIPLHLSPLGTVPKASGGFRLIHHLSFPHGFSVNDAIPKEAAAVSYSTIYDAVDWIRSRPTTVFLAKTDIESAFRIIPIIPQDQPLLGLSWRGQFYMDAVLPMGASSSCAIFSAFSTSLKWVALQKLQATSILHVLDDFLFMADTRSACLRDLQAFMELCHDLGVPIAPNKTMGPSTTLPFLGITLDTVAMEARLPQDKLDKCRAHIQNFLGRSKVTLRELQSLVGTLNFACSVIIPGRAFLRRLIDLTIGLSKPNHHIRLTLSVKEDLRVWLSFLESFNGRTFFLEDKVLSSDYLALYTDASGSIGYGAVLGSKWFYGGWPEHCKSFNIATLELYPIVVSVAIWGHMWRNKTVRFYTDNQALVPVINKLSSKEPNIMRLIRKLVLLGLKFNICFSAHHVPGKSNILADRLSRFQVDEFRRHAPWADLAPTAVPPEWSPDGLWPH